MRDFIIEGSERWVERVPDKYAIQHVEAYVSPVEKEYMLLKFYYVKNCCRTLGSGFIKKCGLVKVPYYIGNVVEGIVICQNDLSELPSYYYKNKDGVEYAGQLTKCEIFNVVYEPFNFSNIIHYSDRDIERQKADEEAPQWLKEFAINHGANVAYFEF